MKESKLWEAMGTSMNFLQADSLEMLNFTQLVQVLTKLEDGLLVEIYFPLEQLLADENFYYFKFPSTLIIIIIIFIKNNVKYLLFFLFNYIYFFVY